MPLSYNLGIQEWAFTLQKKENLMSYKVSSVASLIITLHNPYLHRNILSNTRDFLLELVETS